MAKAINVYDMVSNMSVVEGKYRLHNGLEFETLGEVEAFLKGLEYGKANANIGIEHAIKNTIHAIKEMEI